MRNTKTAKASAAERSLPLRSETNGGFSIVLTLLVIVMMTVLVVGFNAATRTEQMAARNYNFQEQASQLAMLGVNKGVELLNSASTNANVSTQPGRIFIPGSNAQSLSSEAFSGSSALKTNINAWQTCEISGTIYTNYFIATNMNADAFTVPMDDVKNGTNPVVGRYGFWIDDDGSRANLNAANPATRTNFLPTNSRPLAWNSGSFPGVTTAMSADFGSWLQPSSLTDASKGWGWFFTPRQLYGISNLGSTAYNAMMFQVGAGPLNWRPSNSYALSSNGVAAALDVTNGFLAAYGSAGYAGSISALNTALDSVSGKFFRGTNYTTYFGNANGFAAKYGSNGMRQIIANINDAALPGLNGAYTGANTTDMLATNGGGTDLVVPTTVLGLRPAIFLNEVAVGVAYATNGGLDGNPELQVWMQSEMVDPYRTGLGGTYEILYGLKSIEFSGTHQVGSSTVAFSNSTATTNSPVRVGVATNLDGMGQKFLNNPKWFHVPDKAYGFEWQIGTNGTTPQLPAGASNIVITSMTVRPSYVVIRAKKDDPTTVRDWAVFEDFPANGFQFSNPPLSAKSIGFGNSGQSAAPTNVFTQSIEKNDPRVRRFGTNTLDSPAWTNVSTPTLGANNSSVNYSVGTGIAGVGNDRVGTITNIYDHPSFPTNATAAINTTNFILGRSNWISAFDLSKIHTGLQWRTLQFRAQDASESTNGLVPDWALLEAFAVTNTNVAGPAMAYKLNINSLAYPAASSTTAAAVLSAGLGRPQAVASLLTGLSNAASAAAGTNNLGFPAAAGFASASACLPVASNIASLAFTNSWASRRLANAASYQTNLYTLPGEVLEINGVSNFSTDEAANEARAQGIYTGVAVASQVFTIYASGFALDKQTNVVAESRMRAQVARDTNTGKFKIVFLEPLIWP